MLYHPPKNAFNKIYDLWSISGWEVCKHEMFSLNATVLFIMQRWAKLCVAVKILSITPTNSLFISFYFPFLPFYFSEIFEYLY